MNAEYENSLRKLKSTKPYNCKSCGKDIFELLTRLRTIDKNIIGKTTLKEFPIEVWVCNNCKTVCEDLLPEEVQALYADEVIPEVKKSIIIG